MSRAEPRAIIALTAAALGVATKRAIASAAGAPRSRVRGRAAHWVIRSSDLKPFLRFAQECFGMRCALDVFMAAVGVTVVVIWSK